MRSSEFQQLAPTPLQRGIVELRDAVTAKLAYAVGKDTSDASDHDWLIATALAVRDRIVDHWLEATRRADAAQKKQVYYLSIEYLIGRLLFDGLINLGLLDPMREALASMGVDLDRLRALEPDPALGNGGLGRLAACFMDSMASLGIPAIGYGIRYRYGLFKQQIQDGWQQERPDDWLAFRNPWEFERPELTYAVRFGGAVEYVGGNTAQGLWYPAETVLAVGYDMPIVGWRGRHVNTLRLWTARPNGPLNSLQRMDYAAVATARGQVGAISDVLYPSDATPAGQELRLRQEFFFTSAALQDIVRRHVERHDSLDSLPDYAAIQLNDTHPAIAVAELMRILVDDHEYSWADAWDITTRTLNYTNHTLMAEALETWPTGLLGRLLPRHLQIIYLINWYHLNDVNQRGFTDPALVSSLSLVDESTEKRVRMAHLAFVGSHRVNGVSALHSDLMRTTIFRSLEAARPGRIVNETNGISFRRWLYQANPQLTSLLREFLGERVLSDTGVLKELEPLSEDAAFARRFRQVRLHNKSALAECIHELTGVGVESAALFDVHIKRIHEYKRQLLNILESVALFKMMQAQPDRYPPRVKIFAGKAAFDYSRAKLIIKLIHDVGEVINSEAALGGRLKIVFMPNYGVSLAEQIIPAADLSEQISTAGMEASGTGNMKLALNGALTIGTLDGANVEIRDHVGAENFFLFGLTATEVAEKQRSRFAGRDAVNSSPLLGEVLDSIASGMFSPDDPNRYRALIDDILAADRFMLAADFDAYWNAQRAVDALWQQPDRWWRASIMNTARMSSFSSDRTIRGYAEEIWGLGG
jgi:glycogen phosphorylase